MHSAHHLQGVCSYVVEEDTSIYALHFRPLRKCDGLDSHQNGADTPQTRGGWCNPDPPHHI